MTGWQCLKSRFTLLSRSSYNRLYNVAVVAFLQQSTGYASALLSAEALSSNLVSGTNMKNKGGKILIVDDLAGVRSVLVRILTENGWTCLEAENGEDALEVAKAELPDVVLLDKRMPGIDGLEVLSRLQTMDPEIPVIMVTAFGDVQSAVQAMQRGAHHYLTKPFNNEEVVEIVRRAMEKRYLTQRVRALEQQIDKDLPLAETMGSSDSIRKVFAMVNNVAGTSFTVVVYGETGAGKELVANAIHNLSDRKDQAFVAVDCGSIPETLIESELFGYEKGAFTGAERQKLGQFELANGGTLFLDEVGNLPMAMQSKLLRVLQERYLQRIGSKEAVPIDIRVIAAGNQRLEELVEQGKFRQDLYYRLNEFTIEIPPLRERSDDIIYLCKRFIDQTNAELDKNVHGLAQATLDRVLAYNWPGNARELRNVIRRGVLLADDLIQPHHLSGLPTLSFASANVTPSPTLDPKLSLTELVKLHAREFERQVIAETLKQTDGNKSRAARMLKIDYKTLHYKTKDLRL